MKKKEAKRKSFKQRYMRFRNRIQNSKAMEALHNVTTGIMIAIVFILLPGCDEIEEFEVDE